MTGALDAVFDHQELLVFRDAATGLIGAVAIHSTILGPAVGGLRLAAYPRLDDAAVDALRLARAMTLKNAAAGLDLGGGKAVVVDDGGWRDGEVRRARMRAFGAVLERLGGRYITAEDVGTTPRDMDVVAEVTPHVTGLSTGSGDPSAATARTVFDAIAAAADVHLGRGLGGLRVGVLGVGHVGGRLAGLLAASGACVVVADIDAARTTAVAAETGADVLPLDGFVREELDVLAPCALGGAIRTDDVAHLRAHVVCGAANNPLADDSVAEKLADVGVLYVPDFLANCGGIIHVGGDVLGIEADETDRRIGAAGRRVRGVLEDASATGETPLDLALGMARARLQPAPSRAEAAAVP